MGKKAHWLLVCWALLLTGGQEFAAQAGPESTLPPSALKASGTTAAKVVDVNLGPQSYVPDLGWVCLLRPCVTFESKGNKVTLWPWISEEQPLLDGLLHVVSGTLTVNGSLGGHCTLQEGSFVRFDPYGSPIEVLPMSQLRCSGPHPGQQMRFGAHVAVSRGTDFEIAVAEDGRYAVWVYDGVVDVAFSVSRGPAASASFALAAHQGAIFLPDRTSPARLENGQGLREFDRFKFSIGSDRTVRRTRPEDASGDEIAVLMQRGSRLPLERAISELEAFATTHGDNLLLPWATFELWQRGFAAGHASSVEGLADMLRKQYPDSQWTALLLLELQEAALPPASGSGRSSPDGRPGVERGQ